MAEWHIDQAPFGTQVPGRSEVVVTKTEIAMDFEKKEPMKVILSDPANASPAHSVEDPATRNAVVKAVATALKTDPKSVEWFVSDKKGVTSPLSVEVLRSEAGFATDRDLNKDQHLTVPKEQGRVFIDNVVTSKNPLREPQAAKLSEGLDGSLSPSRQSSQRGRQNQVSVLSESHSTGSANELHQAKLVLLLREALLQCSL